MFPHVAWFEFRYQLKSPVFWVGCLIFFLLTYGSITVDQVQIGSLGNVHKNSPYAIVQTLAIMCVFAVFIIVAVVANVVIRDDDTGFAPIVRTTRVSKADYLVGRFVGATAAAFLVLASVPLGILVGSWMPWIDPEKLGPNHIVYYAHALLAFGLPTLLIVAATFFALATMTRSLMWTYVGAVALLVGYFVTRGLLRDPQFDTISALADPFGLSPLALATKYWTAADRNTVLVPLTGMLLVNRLLWAGVALVVFAIAYALFRFDARGAAPRARKNAATVDAALSADELPAAATRNAVALPEPRSDRATRWAQFVRLARFDMAFVFKSPAFFVLIGIGMLNAGGQLWNMTGFYGADLYPATRLVVQTLAGAFAIIPIIIAIYYGGELVWRDRERRMHEIVDATAAPDWAHLIPKIAAITLVLLATVVAAAAAGVAIQAIKGYTQFELLNYLRWFVVPLSISCVLIAVLSVFVQVLVPQKFIGWGVMLLYLVGSIALATAGFEHNLYNYAGTPEVPLTDFDGTSRFGTGRFWFNLYWLAFALMLCVLAYGLWRRGTTVELRPRLKRLPARLRGGAGAVLVIALVAWACIGGFIFYNTNVLNEYVTTPERERRMAELEKALLAYENAPRPKITDVKLDVQLFPNEPRAVTSGTYRIENRTGKPLNELHVRWNPKLDLNTFEIANAAVAKEYKKHFYRIYRLESPMSPGEAREIRFTTTLQQKGFSNADPLTRIVGNGTFINNNEIAPVLGMSRDGLLQDRAKRRKYGLPPELRPAKLEDDSARERSALRNDSDWVDAEITVTTDAGQTPIAPGYTLSDTTTDGRRTVRFKTDAPILHFFSVQSARYEVKRDQWRDVELGVYYQPGHDYNVDRMLAAMKVSLDVFSAKFSPFQFKQARIIEFPSYANFAQSFANTIPYSENIGFLFKTSADDQKIDMVSYVTAHEMAHQWWAHQVISSDQQGATMLVETLAQYGALLVMEQMYGREQIRRFLKYELDRYLRSRGGEIIEELPLARVENQQYIHYQKGTLAMYWLKEVVGEDTVNRALRKLIAEFAFKPAPYPNPTDFLRLLRAEAGPQHEQLITDLFEKITLYDTKVVEATARKRDDGKYEVTMAVEARKLYADGKGNETEAPLDELFDVGVFTIEPGKTGYTEKSILLFERRPIKSGRQVITLVVDSEPKFAGVDPYNKRIDRNSEDNVKRADLPR